MELNSEEASAPGEHESTPVSAGERRSFAPLGLAHLALDDAGVRTILHQFGGSPLLAAGKLNIVGLNAIAERLGPRWLARRDLVREHAERVFRQVLGPLALIQRIGETEFVVAQPQAPRLAGQLQCVNCLREILLHVLGEALDADVRVHEVTRVTEDGVFGRRLDVGQVSSAEAAERLGAPHAADRWSPFTTQAGGRIGVSCSLEPVIQLKNGGQIGYRLASRVQHQPGFAPVTHRELERMAPADIEQIDSATIVRGLDRLRAVAARDQPPALIISVSYGTMIERRGRAMMLSLLREASEFVQHGLICELTEVEAAPAADLQDVVVALDPLCLHVVGRLADIRNEDLRHLAGVGLGGVSARCPDISGDAEFLGYAKQFIRATNPIAKIRLLYQAPDVRRARMAGRLGVSHATLAPQRLKMRLADDEPR
jgi:hypothetical protein